jgi:hypothetical protein
VLAVEIALWVCLGLIAWTHAVYPLFAAALARVRARPPRSADIEPRVVIVVAAYNEATVIERRVENLLALDYPADKLRIVVSSDASSDGTNELVEAIGDILQVFARLSLNRDQHQDGIEAVRHRGGEGQRVVRPLPVVDPDRGDPAFGARRQELGHRVAPVGGAGPGGEGDRALTEGGIVDPRLSPLSQGVRLVVRGAERPREQARDAVTRAAVCRVGGQKSRREAELVGALQQPLDEGALADA